VDKVHAGEYIRGERSRGRNSRAAAPCACKPRKQVADGVVATEQLVHRLLIGKPEVAVYNWEATE
jgi:hypothetical protein